MVIFFFLSIGDFYTKLNKLYFIWFHEAITLGAIVPSLCIEASSHKLLIINIRVLNLLVIIEDDFRHFKSYNILI